MSAQGIAARINQKFKPGDRFASAFYGWAGTPWRPGDTDVAFKRCWAKGDVVYIETTQPYQDMSTTLLIVIHAPSGVIEVGDGLRIERAKRVVVDGQGGMPPADGEGYAFETR